jgi:hypothetical protein
MGVESRGGEGVVVGPGRDRVGRHGKYTLGAVKMEVRTQDGDVVGDNGVEHHIQVRSHLDGVTEHKVAITSALCGGHRDQ